MKLYQTLIWVYMYLKGFNFSPQVIFYFWKSVGKGTREKRKRRESVGILLTSIAVVTC